MDKFSTSMSLNLIPKVKPEPEKKIYKIERLPHFTPLYNYNAQGPETVEENKSFRKESVVHLENLEVFEKDGQHILKECLNYSMGNTENKMGLSKILPGCKDVVPNQKEPVVKIKNSEVINKFEKGDDFEEWKIKNEDIYIKEECLEPHETSMSSYFCEPEKHKVYSTLQYCQNDILHIKPNVKNHLIEHKNIKEINMFKCDQCDYRATRKYCLKQHLLLHKDPEVVNMFKCDQCNYQAVRKDYLKSHLLRHKNPEEVKMFQCDLCNYRTIQKSNLKQHILGHKNPEEINMFKCDQCDYQAKRKDRIKQHLLVHKNPEEANMFQCDLCKYRTIRKNHLKRHLLRHKNPKEIKMFKCDQCDYQTVRKDYLKSHFLRHKNPEELDRFQCNLCNYRTVRKSDLKKHLLKHKNPEEGRS